MAIPLLPGQAGYWSPSSLSQSSATSLLTSTAKLQVGAWWSLVTHFFFFKRRATYCLWPQFPHLENRTIITSNSWDCFQSQNSVWHVSGAWVSPGGSFFGCYLCTRHPWEQNHLGRGGSVLGVQTWVYSQCSGLPGQENQGENVGNTRGGNVDSAPADLGARNM